MKKIILTVAIAIVLLLTSCEKNPDKCISDVKSLTDNANKISQNIVNLDIYSPTYDHDYNVYCAQLQAVNDALQKKIDECY